MMRARKKARERAEALVSQMTVDEMAKSVGIRCSGN